MKNDQSKEAARHLSGPTGKNPIEHVKMQIVIREFADLGTDGEFILTYERKTDWEWF